MITTDLTTLKINKLTKAQYEAALAAGNINENELYMTPESEAGSGGDYATKSDLNAHVNDTTLHTTADEKTKLAGIEANANNYTHPSSHPATMITEDATHRFVTDAEKAAWNEKNVFIATYDTTTNAEMEAALDAGKIVFVSMNNKIFIPLMYRFGSTHIFVQLKPRDNGSTVDQAIMVKCSDNIWSSTPIQIIPLVTTSDKGKVLMVNESGSWAATSIPKPAITATTLLASSWDSTAKTYSFESTYPNASYDIEVALDSTATSEQAEAFNGAQIVGSATSNIIKAYGDVPTIDIPIILKGVKK